ncbi:general substrate transporter [Sistotremastrum niveocremeum HHB9708]|uniref:General substrate transporter n=1 Tax=Sistotremastrum niveocremeum HHB9708 TaxID=1314777 RepID=A0A164ZSH1_9AGAM|nr:general substrate transporter [Sistotremastrum niveocremeum HHB9708]
MSYTGSDPEKFNEDKQVVTEHFHIERIKDVSAAKDVDKVIEVRSGALAAATTKAGRLDPWSKDSLLLYWCCFVAFLCSCANGYDGSLMTAINIMPFYQDRINHGTVGEGTGIIFSIYTIGGLVGPWFAGPLTDRLGRRGGMFCGGLIICIGSAVIASSMHRAQFIAGRFILGFGVSIMTCAAPSYIIEVSPPQWRSRMTAFYNCGWFGGSIPAAGITLGTQKINSDWQWRLPLIFQAVPSLIVMISVFFLPESPRWLLANSRDDEALAFLTRFHGNNDPTNPVVELEWQEFKESISVDGADKRWWDYSELFKTRSARWRSLMVILMGVFGQFSGNGLGYFNTQIYQAVGYGNYMQFVLNLANSITSAAGALTGVALSDRMPRRLALVWGTFGSAVFLAINGALSAVWAHQPAGQQNLSVGRGAVAAYFFFNIVYSFAYTPLQALYPVECLQTTARAKGMAMYGVVVNLLNFINQFAGPIALQNIKYNYVFIFVGWDLVETVLWYIFCIETNGRTLEELEEVFAQKNPIKASKVKRRVAIKKDGGIALVE